MSLHYSVLIHIHKLVPFLQVQMSYKGQKRPRLEKSYRKFFVLAAKVKHSSSCK